MPVFILWKLVGAAAIGAAGYAAKKWADGRMDSSDDFSSADDDEWERMEARLRAHQLERMTGYLRTLLAEKGIEHSSEERERLAELAIDPDQWSAFEAMVDELAARAPAVREIDARIETTEHELAELETLAAELNRLNKDKS